jgi:hypothetical protein
VIPRCRTVHYPEYECFMAKKAMSINMRAMSVNMRKEVNENVSI